MSDWSAQTIVNFAEELDLFIDVAVGRSQTWEDDALTLLGSDNLRGISTPTRIGDDQPLPPLALRAAGMSLSSNGPSFVRVFLGPTPTLGAYRDLQATCDIPLAVEIHPPLPPGWGVTDAFDFVVRGEIPMIADIYALWRLGIRSSSELTAVARDAALLHVKGFDAESHVELGRCPYHANVRSFVRAARPSVPIVLESKAGTPRHDIEELNRMTEPMSA